MQSSPAAPMSPEHGDALVTRAAHRGCEPAGKEAPQSRSVGDGVASTSATESGSGLKAESLENCKEQGEIEEGNEGESDDDSDDGSETSEGSSSDGEVSGLAALIRKLALKAEEKLALASSQATTGTEPIEDAVPEIAVPPPPVLSSFDVSGIADHIRSGKCTNIIVMAGAGISVSAGIPDFRTPGTGLYDNLQKYDLPHPTAVFELDFFKQNPEPFYLLAKELYPGQYPPTPTHHFVRLLHKKGLLLRCFTQNIDSLERASGVPAEKIVAAHGNFDTARCLRGHACDVERVRAHVDQGVPMRCDHVIEIVDQTGNEKRTKTCGVLVKPDIVFFGENLPERFEILAMEDFPKCDLLIVAGTSLAVHPFAGLINHPKEDVPRLLVNREVVGAMDERVRAMAKLVGHDTARFGFDFGESNRRDALFLGDCDDGFYELARLLGWHEELDRLVEAGKNDVRAK